jgi:hypothetical protein
MVGKNMRRRMKTLKRSIPVVVDDAGVRYDASVLGDGVAMHEGIYCASCRVPATSVAPHPHTSPKGHVTALAGYFRTKHKGEGHRPECRFDFDRQLQRIVLDAGPDVLTKERGLYKLHLPLDEAPQPRSGTSHPSGSASGDVRWAVLSTAARIQRLLAGYERAPEAAEFFVAEYHGREIPWGHFCWDVTRPDQAAELVTELRRPDWGQMRHPIAVWTWNASRPKRNATHGHRLTLTLAQDSGVVARLRTDDPTVFSGLDPAHRCVMGYGDWRVRPVDRRTDPELELRVGHGSAVTSWPTEVWPPRAWMHRT